MLKYSEYDEYPAFPGIHKPPCKLAELPLLGGKYNFKRSLLRGEPQKSPYTRQKSVASKPGTEPPEQYLNDAEKQKAYQREIELLMKQYKRISPEFFALLQQKHKTLQLAAERPSKLGGPELVLKHDPSVIDHTHPQLAAYLRSVMDQDGIANSIFGLNYYKRRADPSEDLDRDQILHLLKLLQSGAALSPDQLQDLINAFGELNPDTLARLLDFLQAEGTLTPQMLSYLQELLLKAGGDLTPHQLAMILNALEGKAAQNSNSAGSVGKGKTGGLDSKGSLRDAKKARGGSNTNDPYSLNGSGGRDGEDRAKKTGGRSNSKRDEFGALEDRHPENKAKIGWDMKNIESGGAFADGTGAGAGAGAKGTKKGGGMDKLGKSDGRGPLDTKYKQKKAGGRRDSDKWNSVVAKDKAKKAGAVGSRKNRDSATGIHSNGNRSSDGGAGGAAGSAARDAFNRSQKEAGVKGKGNREAKDLNSVKSKKTGTINDRKNHGNLLSSFTNRGNNASGVDSRGNRGSRGGVAVNATGNKSSANGVADKSRATSAVGGGGTTGPGDEYGSAEAHGVSSKMEDESGNKRGLLRAGSKETVDGNRFDQGGSSTSKKVPQNTAHKQNLPGVKDQRKDNLGRSTSAGMGIDSMGRRHPLYYEPWDVENVYKDLRAFNHLAKNARRRRLPRHSDMDLMEIKLSQMGPSTAASKIRAHEDPDSKAAGSAKKQRLEY